MCCRIGLIFLLWVVLTLDQTKADETWKRPLAEKAETIEQGIQKRHNILGLYPSMVEIPRDSDTIDITTTNPFADVQHAVCWTANYLAGLSYRYAYLRKSNSNPEKIEEAKVRADQVFESIYRCQLVTGVRGLQARGYFLGRGESYAERRGSDKIPYWRQGEIDGQSFRWVGDPSHHNYSDTIHGLGQYYTLAAEGSQKERARQAIGALVSYWVDNDLKIAKYDKSLPMVPVLGLADHKTLNTRVMMAIAGAKVAYHATGEEKFKQIYDQLVDQYGVRKLTTFSTGKDFDDAEHVFCHLDLLFRIEDDASLLASYQQVADGLWCNHKDDAQSLFTYIYYAIVPQAEGKEKALKEALYTLQTFPTDMTIKPRMNSLNPNLKPPYPTYLAAWDNEYIWKANLLRADGWHSRIVVDVAVSPEDPKVILAVGEGGHLYQSRDGASTWQNWRPIDQNLTSHIKRVDVGGKTRILAVACNDGFYLTTSGGRLWHKMAVRLEGDTPVDIEFDPNNFNILYAVTNQHIYRSQDYGEEYLGQSWQKLSTSLPVLQSPTFLVAHGSPTQLYAISESRIFSRRLDKTPWIRGRDYSFPRYGQAYPWIVADAENSSHIWVGYKVSSDDIGSLSILQESHGAGQSWSNNVKDILRILAEKGMLDVIKLGLMMQLDQTVIGSNNRFFAITDRGVAHKQALGWKKSTTGFSIPLVKSLFASSYTDWIFAGTPGGLYISKNQGKSWEDGNLWLQFDQNTRRELGGASFIDAYWRARYYGFIRDQQAEKPFD